MKKYTAALAVIILILIISIILVIDPKFNYVRDWHRIEGIWEIIPDNSVADNKYNRMPELNGIIIKTNTRVPGVMNKSYPIWISFCQIVPNPTFGKRVDTSTITNELKGVTVLTNTGINIMIRLDNTKLIDSSRMYNFEFLSVSRKKIFGYIAGPTFDSIVIMKRIA